jgi:hypothetical protein
MTGFHLWRDLMRQWTRLDVLAEWEHSVRRDELKRKMMRELHAFLGTTNISGDEVFESESYQCEIDYAGIALTLYQVVYIGRYRALRQLSAKHVVFKPGD